MAEDVQQFPPVPSIEPNVCQVGQPCAINLDIPEISLPEDLDKLKAELTRPSGKREPVKVTMNPEGNVAIDFTPEEVGKHFIDLKKNGRPVDGSPFEVVVEEASFEKENCRVGQTCAINLDIPEISLPGDLDKLKAELTRPSGKREPVKVTMNPEGNVEIDFTPEEVGKHFIDLKKNGRPVDGSPFEVVVEEASFEKRKLQSWSKV